MNTGEGLARTEHSIDEPKPTIGRIVHYTFQKNADESDRGQSDTVPAIIVQVWSDVCVNLRVFQDGDANPRWQTSVVKRDESNEANGDYWEWPTRA
jgi:hypothetical protein